MKRVLFFNGAKTFVGKENFAHTAQLFFALDKIADVELFQYHKGKLFSKDFFSKRNDLIVSVGFFSSYFILMKKLGLVRCPIVHSWNDDYHKGGGFGGKWLRKKIEYWTVKNADYNLTCSKYRLSEGKRLSKKIKFIPHGVSDKWNSIKAKKLRGKNLVYIGELSKRKGSYKIINLAKNNPKIKFHFFGRTKKGEERIIKNLPKNIKFHGWVTNEESISYCKGSDILLHPTDNDSTLKIHNYIKCKKPIIAIPGQINYLLKHKFNAFITADFQRGLRDLLTDKSLYKKLSKNINKHKINLWKHVRKEFKSYISNILKNEKKQN